MTHNQKKNKPIETEPEMTKMMEESFLEDKGLKIAVVKKKKNSCCKYAPCAQDKEGTSENEKYTI